MAAEYTITGGRGSSKPALVTVVSQTRIRQATTSLMCACSSAWLAADRSIVVTVHRVGLGTLCAYRELAVTVSRPVPAPATFGRAGGFVSGCGGTYDWLT